MVYINCVSFFKHMQKLTSSSTHFDIWYNTLLDKVVNYLKKGINFVLPLNQVNRKLFDIRLFEKDIENICHKIKVRFICHCFKNETLYIVPIQFSPTLTRPLAGRVFRFSKNYYQIPSQGIRYTHTLVFFGGGGRLCWTGWIMLMFVGATSQSPDIVST